MLAKAYIGVSIAPLVLPVVAGHFTKPMQKEFDCVWFKHLLEILLCI